MMNDDYYSFIVQDESQAVSYTHLDVYKRQHENSNLYKMLLSYEN